MIDRPAIAKTFAAVAAVATLVGVGLGVHSSLSSASAATRTTPIVTPTAGETVVAIGDSIMSGHGLDADQSWPAVVARDNGWTLTNLAADGDGFVTPGNDETIFSDQVEEAIARRPQLVMLSGSSNDLGVPESAVRAAIDRAVTTLRRALPDAIIVAVTPVWNEKASPTQLDRINDDVQAAVQKAGGIYLDIGRPLLGRADMMQSDDVHPTAAGQLAIAAAVETALQKTHLE